jgi:hypothetical protein
VQLRQVAPDIFWISGRSMAGMMQQMLQLPHSRPGTMTVMIQNNA